jgi:hypothetical protein
MAYLLSGTPVAEDMIDESRQAIIMLGNFIDKDKIIKKAVNKGQSCITTKKNRACRKKMTLLVKVIQVHRLLISSAKIEATSGRM